jgi:hypothetical protein
VGGYAFPPLRHVGCIDFIATSTWANTGIRPYAIWDALISSRHRRGRIRYGTHRGTMIHRGNIEGLATTDRRDSDCRVLMGQGGVRCVAMIDHGTLREANRLEAGHRRFWQQVTLPAVALRSVLLRATSQPDRPGCAVCSAYPAYSSLGFIHK